MWHVKPKQRGPKPGMSIVSVRATVLICAFLACLNTAQAAPPENWQGAWAHSPTAYNDRAAPPRADGTPAAQPGYAPLAPYRDVTVRQVVRISAPALAIRLRFTNEFGARDLHIGAAHIALAGENGAILPGSDHVITFAGSSTVEIPPGAPMVSDIITWVLPAPARLSISIHYPGETVPPAHTIFALDAWQSGGEHASDITLPMPIPAPSGLHVSQIDILPAHPGATLVAFGDSITEGVASTRGAFRGWPERLAERLQADSKTQGWSVVNAGIGSNRLLHDMPSTNALSRFDRDVLSVPGARAVIVLLGINDIQYTHRYPHEAVRASAEIAALRQLITRAHAAGLRIYGATITPFEGSADYTAEGEADRQAINSFIRSGAFDGIVDFDKVLRDSARTSRLRAELESHGHLHPNDEGYAVMGDSVPLSLFNDK
jgi:lysophospholipase L1-like esterase